MSAKNIKTQISLNDKDFPRLAIESRLLFLNRGEKNP